MNEDARKKLLLLNFFSIMFLVKSLGDRIKNLRAEKNMTLAVLAERSQLSKGLLSKIENDPEVNPSLETLNSLATALDVTISDLLESECVQATRFIPETPPTWSKDLFEHFKRIGQAPDKDLVDLLYAMQHRKASLNMNVQNWLSIYNLLDMTISNNDRK